MAERNAILVLSLLAWLALCFLAALAGASATLQAGTFYEQLVRPSWAPPAALFAPVWSVLYAMMAVAAWLVWQRRERPLAHRALLVFLAQLVLNALWSWLFFGWRLGAWSFVDIVLLWGLILTTLLYFRKLSFPAALLLIPYLGWVSFAAVLNYAMWQLNPAVLR
jgi:tryptophan-rich sensory protein